MATSNESKLKYNQKTYQQYAIKLRKVEDAELIQKIEALKAQGLNTSEAFKQLINR